VYHGGDITSIETIRRSKQVRFPSSKLVGHELFHDSEVIDNGELAHLTFLLDT